jgi:hypothetical protein
VLLLITGSDTLTIRRRREFSRSFKQASCAQCNYSFIPIRQAAIQCSRHTHSQSITPSARMGDVQQLLRNVSSLCEDLPMLPGKLIASVRRTLLTVRQLVGFCPWRSYMRMTREMRERRTSKASSLAEVMICLLQRPRVGKLTQSLWSSQPATMSEYISAYRATIAYILPALS